jgi:DNA-binding GntR family transcriptional regulator
MAAMSRSALGHLTASSDDLLDDLLLNALFERRLAFGRRVLAPTSSELARLVGCERWVAYRALSRLEHRQLVRERLVDTFELSAHGWRYVWSSPAWVEDGLSVAV